MHKLAKITFTLILLAGLQSLTSGVEAAHRGGGIANGFGPGFGNGNGRGGRFGRGGRGGRFGRGNGGGGNNGNGNGGGGGNNGNGPGGGNNGNGGGNGGGGGGGAQGAPAPLLAASLLGQSVLFGGGFMAWRRRRNRKLDENENSN